MMAPLLFTALAMLFVTALCLFWPRRAYQQYTQTPAQLFEERLQLLALARDSGELAEQDFDAAAQELKTQFLSQQQQAQLSQPGSGWRLPLVLLLLVTLLVGGIYAVTGHYRQLDDWQQAQQQLQQFGERALLGQGEPLSEQEMELFALGLRTRLANEGDDAVAWMLLGRIRLSQGAAEQAVAAFERALKLSPERVPLLLSYAQALILLGDDNSLARAGRAVAKVLTREASNTDALSLMALIAYEKGDMAEATSAWQLLLEQLPKEDPRYAAVQQRLTELGVDIKVPGRQITVNLFVDPRLKQANPDASLFLFARAAEGPGLPLAVQRVPLPEGQLQLVLTEQMAMQSEWTLASADKVQVVARLSQSGTVELRPGDIQAESGVLDLTANTLTISLTLEP
ncbi:c-type cytochrome biogenesis protein CcmI [Rheinheimera nanhaiensis]|uniref:Cytochrome c-type biogenesis protein CcmH n=1 Tax=Rheinheimera nanhaiensis E407-8 TaxID=562729 RepID=I1DWE2_9GAMM|nr:c-type cytochrome biogenesis protein CcmI [Rheinheimera nanhaiensis]GAB58370.1 cytochrome c-type biogenesis protein CcmH [Rheinheimera nanhaiensis E407-8]